MALSVAQVATYLFPLVTVPYLSRVLGVAGWGLVAFTQAFGACLMLVVEFGYSLSATREVARHRGDNEKLAEILAGVIGAKCLFGTGAVGVALVARWWIPLFRSHPDLLWAGTFWAMAQAFSMMWFFQGREQMKVVASLDFSAKALTTIGIFILVRFPTDAWKVLALQGAGAVISFLVSLWLAYRDVGFRLPQFDIVWVTVRLGWNMFIFRASVSLYTVGNAFILGLFVPPLFVGYYAGAEKISKAMVNLLSPVTQTLYPRMSYLAQSARERAARLARASLILMGLSGLAMGAVLFLFAPMLVRVILGNTYEAAVPVLRILSLLPPLIGLSGVFGIQWMLPLGLDRAFNTIILLAGLINVGLGIALAPSLKAVGMAWAVVAAEIFVVGAMYYLLHRRGLNPASANLWAQGGSM